MNRNEIIAKMAVIGCLRTPKAQVAEECLKCEFQNSCNPYRHAQLLYDTGYQQPVVHAHWEIVDLGTEDGDFEAICTHCKERFLNFFQDYCPNCGSKMDEKDIK